MRCSSLLSLLLLAFSPLSARADLLETLLGISIGGNALINIDLNAGLLSQGTCNAQNAVVGINTKIALLGINLVSVCACVTALAGVQGSGTGVAIGLLGSGGTQYSCPKCPGGASPTCVSGGACACACPSGTYADTVSGTCVAVATCSSSCGTLTYSSSMKATAMCTCNAGFTQSSTTGQCVCPAGSTIQADGTCQKMSASQRARMARRQLPEQQQPEKREILGGHRAYKLHNAHRVAHQHRSLPINSGAAAAAGLLKRGDTCPDGETACPTRGGFLCTDTTTDLTSCGGCVDPKDGSGEGENCLAIPGALNVQCYQSRCLVASCFKGWRFDGSRCV